MPPELRKAHHALDTTIDRLYRKEPFLSDVNAWNFCALFMKNSFSAPSQLNEFLAAPNA
jgi:hypothetical protein